MEERLLNIDSSRKALGFSKHSLQTVKPSYSLMVNSDDSSAPNAANKKPMKAAANKKPMRAAANKAVESQSKLKTRTSNPKPRTPSKMPMPMPVTVEEVAVEGREPKAAAPPSSKVINSDDYSASVLSNAEKKKKRMRAKVVESDSQKSKPVDDASELKKRRSNPNPIIPPAAETVEEEEEVAEKSALPQKLWSEEDEIVILQGMVEYKEAKGADPMSDTADFHDFIKKSLHVDASKRQVVDKVRRLKRRYQTIGCKKDLTPHEEKTIQLSKLIWINIANTTTPSKPTTTPSKPTTTTKVSFMGKWAVEMGLNEDFVKAGIQLCSEDDKADMEERWKQLYLDEDALFLRKMELVSEETNLITQAIDSAGIFE